MLLVSETSIEIARDSSRQPSQATIEQPARQQMPKKDHDAAHLHHHLILIIIRF